MIVVKIFEEKYNCMVKYQDDYLGLYDRKCRRGSASFKDSDCVERCKRYYKDRFIPIDSSNITTIGNPINLVFE